MKTLHTVLFAAVGLALATTAFADNCKSPKVKVVNDKAQTIKVTKIQYFDGCDNKWRTEDVSAREISAGGNFTFTDNLEYVGNCKISKFKLYRAVPSRPGRPTARSSGEGSSSPTKARTRSATRT